MRNLGLCWCLAFSAFLVAAAQPGPNAFHFVIMGDRTGEAERGIYESVWAEAAGTRPAFVVTTGDTIQGLNDSTANAEWEDVQKIIAPYRRYSLYLAPGNHDIWSEASEALFRKYAGHAAHYGFDYGPAHFTILDNSRSDQLSSDELAFLREDLKAHTAQKWKFVISHRPSWILNAVTGNPGFELHQLARRYGVQYVIAGHVHEMLHYKLEDIDYVSMPSAGGHLRASGKYEDGWFFGYALVEVGDSTVEFQLHQLSGHNTLLSQWGTAGLEGRK
jgi:3',5'-cyclic-AMP phosphodiesterase